MKNLIIDFDNTLANSSKTAYFLECEEQSFDTADAKFSMKNLEWGFGPYLRDEAAKHAVHVVMDSQEFFDKLEPIEKPDKIAACIKMCRAKGFKVYVCTAREHKVYDNLRAWCDKYFPNLIDDIIIKKPGSFDKSFVAGDIIIDDKPECLVGGERKVRILYGEALYTKTELHDCLAAGKSFNNIAVCKNWPQVKETLEELFDNMDYSDEDDFLDGI